VPGERRLVEVEPVVPDVLPVVPLAPVVPVEPVLPVPEPDIPVPIVSGLGLASVVDPDPVPPVFLGAFFFAGCAGTSPYALYVANATGRNNRHINIESFFMT